MPTPASFLVLYDASPYAAQALLVAHQWSNWAGAELHLLHDLEEIYAPAMADQEARQQVYAHSKSEAFDQLQQAYQQLTGIPPKPQNIHISVKNLSATVDQLSAALGVQLLFAGLKGNSKFKRLLTGSTVLRLLDHISIPLVSIPKHLDPFSQLTLHVSVSYHHPLNSKALEQFIALMCDKVAALVFLSVLTPEDDPRRAQAQLDKLQALFSEHGNVSACLFEGKEPLRQVKSYMLGQREGVLVVQNGGRALSDHFFRSFFIDELVQDASLPLVILPT